MAGDRPDHSPSSPWLQWLFQDGREMWDQWDTFSGLWLAAFWVYGSGGANNNFTSLQWRPPWKWSQQTRKCNREIETDDWWNCLISWIQPCPILAMNLSFVQVNKYMFWFPLIWVGFCHLQLEDFLPIQH